MHTHIMTAGKRILAGAFLGLLILGGFSSARAVDLPKAPGSPIAGIAFDDQPLILPVQRNFQMAMLLASSEMGRSCGKMEAYGWRLDGTEQQRVNQIFNNTVDRLRAQGFVVESKSSNAVSRDVTLFTSDRADKHLLSLWSAGEIGLVMILCETSAPLPSSPSNAMKSGESSSALASRAASLASTSLLQPAGQIALNAAGQQQPADRATNRVGKPVYKDFSPVGSWVGTYTCAQGTTGATLRIEKIRGDQFEGEFDFYPTPRNPYVARGSYKVFGEYDADSQRILVNPGEWIDRPKDFYNTIMIGSFDPVFQTLSAYFQGISGCTSFEARLTEAGPAPSKPSLQKKKPEDKKATKLKKVEKTKKKDDGAAAKAKKAKKSPAKELPESKEPAAVEKPSVKRSSSLEPPASMPPTPIAPPGPTADPLPPAPTASPAETLEEKPPQGIAVGGPAQGE